MSNMQDDTQPFLLRVWKGAIEGEPDVWFGRIQHIISGDAYLFRDWPTLIAILEDNLRGHDSDKNYQRKNSIASQTDDPPAPPDFESRAEATLATPEWEQMVHMVEAQRAQRKVRNTDE